MAELRIFSYTKDGNCLSVEGVAVGTPLFVYTEENGRWLVEVLSREVVERDGYIFEDTTMRCLTVLRPYKSNPPSEFVHPVTEGTVFMASTQLPGPAAWGLFNLIEDVERVLAQRDLQRRIQAGSAKWTENGWV